MPSTNRGDSGAAKTPGSHGAPCIVPTTNASVIIRLQNLAWEARSHDIRQFFSGLTIPDGGVHIIGGSEGDAFIAFQSDEDARKAMLKNGERLCGNQIRLLLSSKNEMYGVIAQAKMASPYYQMTSAITNFGGPSPNAALPNAASTEETALQPIQQSPLAQNECSPGQWYRLADTSTGQSTTIPSGTTSFDSSNDFGLGSGDAVRPAQCTNSNMQSSNEPVKQLTVSEVQQRLSDMLTSATLRSNQDGKDATRPGTDASGGNNHAVALNFAQQLFSLLEMNTPKSGGELADATNQANTGIACDMPNYYATDRHQTHISTPLACNDVNPTAQALGIPANTAQPFYYSQQLPSPFGTTPGVNLRQPSPAFSDPHFGTPNSHPFQTPLQFAPSCQQQQQQMQTTSNTLINSLPRIQQDAGGPFDAFSSQHLPQSSQFNNPIHFFQGNPAFGVPGNSSTQSLASLFHSPSISSHTYSQQNADQGGLATRHPLHVNLMATPNFTQIQQQTEQQIHHPGQYGTSTSEFSSVSPYLNFPQFSNDPSSLTGQSFFNSLLNSVNPQQANGPQISLASRTGQSIQGQYQQPIQPPLSEVNSQVALGHSHLQASLHSRPYLQTPNLYNTSMPNLQSVAPVCHAQYSNSYGLMKPSQSSANFQMDFDQQSGRESKPHPILQTPIDVPPAPLNVSEPFLRMSGLTQHPYRQIHHLLYPTLRIRLRDIKLINDAEGKCTGVAVICFNCIEDAKNGLRLVTNRTSASSTGVDRSLTRIKAEPCTEYEFVCAVDSYMPAAMRKQTSEGFYAVRIIGFSFRWDKRDIRRYFEGVNFHSRDKIIILQTDHRQPSHNIAIALLASELDLDRALFYDNEDTGHGKLSVTSVDKDQVDLETSSARYRQQQRSALEDRGREFTHASLSRAGSSQRGQSSGPHIDGRPSRRMADDDRDSSRTHALPAGGLPSAGTGGATKEGGTRSLVHEDKQTMPQTMPGGSPPQNKRFRPSKQQLENPTFLPGTTSTETQQGNTSHRTLQEGTATVIKLSGFPTLYTEGDIKILLQRAGLLPSVQVPGHHDPELVMVDPNDHGSDQKQGNAVLVKFRDHHQCRRAITRSRNILSAKSIEIQIISANDNITKSEKDTEYRSARDNSAVAVPEYRSSQEGSDLRPARESRFSSASIPTSQASGSPTGGRKPDVENRRRSTNQFAVGSDRGVPERPLASPDHKRQSRHGATSHYSNSVGLEEGSHKYQSRNEYQPHHGGRSAADRDNRGKHDVGGAQVPQVGPRTPSDGNPQFHSPSYCDRRDVPACSNQRTLPPEGQMNSGHHMRFHPDKQEHRGSKYDFSKTRFQRDNSRVNEINRSGLGANTTPQIQESPPSKRPLLPDPIHPNIPNSLPRVRGPVPNQGLGPNRSFPNNNAISQDIRGPAPMHQAVPGVRRNLGQSMPRNLPPIPQELEHLSGQILLLDNVPYRATKEDILNWLGRFRPLEATLKIRHDDSGRPTGHAIVALDSPRAAEAANQILPGITLLGRHVEIIMM